MSECHQPSKQGLGRIGLTLSLVTLSYGDLFPVGGLIVVFVCFVICNVGNRCLPYGIYIIFIGVCIRCVTSVIHLYIVGIYIKKKY